MQEFDPRLNPDGRYPMQGRSPTTVERRASEVLALLPKAVVERTRDVFQFTVGDENGIVVVVTAEALELRLTGVEWTCGSYGPALTSRLWKRVDWEQVGAGGLPKQIRALRAARRSKLRKCRFCGGLFPPGRMLGSEDACHGCAERHLHVVF